MTPAHLQAALENQIAAGAPGALALIEAPALDDVHAVGSLAPIAPATSAAL